MKPLILKSIIIHLAWIMMKWWLCLFPVSHTAPNYSTLGATAQTYSASLLRLLTCHTHDYQYWHWNPTCACPWGCCAMGRGTRGGGRCRLPPIYITCSTACVTCIYTNIQVAIGVVGWVCVCSALQIISVSTLDVLRPSPFLSVRSRPASCVCAVLNQRCVKSEKEQAG